MDAAHELHRQQLIKAYNNAVKRKDWQAARNYRDELNILIAKKVALSCPPVSTQMINEFRISFPRQQLSQKIISRQASIVNN